MCPRGSVPINMFSIWISYKDGRVRNCRKFLSYLSGGVKRANWKFFPISCFLFQWQLPLLILYHSYHNTETIDIIMYICMYHSKNNSSFMSPILILMYFLPNYYISPHPNITCIFYQNCQSITCISWSQHCLNITCIFLYQYCLNITCTF